MKTLSKSSFENFQSFLKRRGRSHSQGRNLGSSLARFTACIASIEGKQDKFMQRNGPDILYLTQEVWGQTVTWPQVILHREALKDN